MNLFGYRISWFAVGIFGLIVLVLAYYLGGRTGKAKNQNADAKAIAKDIDQSALSYETSQYDAWAQKIFIALYDLFKDQDAVYSVFSKMRTKSDVLQLIHVFGVKKNLFWAFDGKTLPEWIYQRLNEDEINKINDILKRNNIDYQF
jgi:hypothetical protein